MEQRRSVDAVYRMPDQMWERLEPLLPRFHRSRKGGRPRLNLRGVMDGIFYVLRTGCQWKALPPEFGSGSSVHRYFQMLVERETFSQLWAIALLEYDELKGLEWKWQSMDGAMTKAPLGGEKNRGQSNGSSQARRETESAHRWQWHPARRIRQRSQHA